MAKKNHGIPEHDDDMHNLLDLLFTNKVIQKRKESEKDNLIDLNIMYIVELNVNEQTELNNTLKVFNIDWAASIMNKEIVAL